VSRALQSNPRATQAAQRQTVRRLKKSFLKGNENEVELFNFFIFFIVG